MTEPMQWRAKATITSGSLLRRSEALKSLRHNLRAQSQGHHTVDSLEERGVERGFLERTRKGRAVLKAALLGKLLRDGGMGGGGGTHNYGLFQTIDTILN